MTALAGMQEHVFSAYDSIQCTPSADYGLDKQKFVNWNPYVEPADDAARGARRVVRHVLLRDRLRLLPARRTRAARACSSGRARFGFGEPTGLDIGGEADGLAADARLAQEDVRERLGPGLEPRRLDPARDRPEGPARDAAADGRASTRCSRTAASIVTPYLVSDVEQPRREGLSARRAPPLRAQTPPQPSGVDPARSTAVRDGLYLATHSTDGHVVRRLRQLPRRRSRGRPGPRRRSCRCPAIRADHLEDQSWWCGWGPSTDAQHRRLRADRERRPRLHRRRARGAEGVRAILRRRGARASIPSETD